MKSPQSSGQPKKLSLAPYLRERPDLKLRKRSGPVLDIVKQAPKKVVPHGQRLVESAKKAIHLPKAAHKSAVHDRTVEDGGAVQKPTKWPLIIRRVQGHSMVPVLPPGTTVWGTQWFRKLKRGDVVIFAYNNKELIKRIEKIDRNRLFVLGDHAETSTDSRHFGTIPYKAVIAKIIHPHTRP